MTLKFPTRFAAIALALAMVSGYAPKAFAQYTTNGNGGKTDVGTWYAALYPLNNPAIAPFPDGDNGLSQPDFWALNGFAMNNLPLEPPDTNEYTPTEAGWIFTGADGTAPSTTPSPVGIFSPNQQLPYLGGFQQYDSTNPAVIAQDMANLAAAKIDFIVFDMTNGGLGGVESVSNWTATYAGAVIAGAAAWNANHAWKIRVTFAVGAWLGDVEGQAQAVWTQFVHNRSYGTPDNWYQIDGKPVLVDYAGGVIDPSCGVNNGCPGTGHFQLEYAYANNQGPAAGSWGWVPPLTGTVVDPAGLVEQVSPGYQTSGGTEGPPYVPRNDGAYYESNWNVVFDNPLPRIVFLTAYNDWLEEQGFGINDTLTLSLPPIPFWFIAAPGPPPAGSNRIPEVWTLPDGNVTLDGYWNYTIDAIRYLRDGGAKPAWPQVAPNLAVSADRVTASSVESGSPASAVNDGNIYTEWSSQALSQNPSTPVTIDLHFDTPVLANTVALMGRSDLPNCFPVSFAIQIWDGTTWQTRVQETNFPQPSSPGTPIAFRWARADRTTDVRLEVTEMSQDPVNAYRVQLAEFEVFNEISTPTAPMFANWGFETPGLGGFDADQYNPTDAGWTFTGQAGVQEIGTGSVWQSPMPPQGIQTAFIQSGPPDSEAGVISQSLTFPAGRYAIRFMAAQRTNAVDTTAGPEGIDVYLDSKLIGSFRPLPASGVFTPYETPSFTTKGGSLHTISFKGTNAGDNTAFIDAVQILNQPIAREESNGFRLPISPAGGRVILLPSEH